MKKVFYLLFATTLGCSSQTKHKDILFPKNEFKIKVSDELQKKGAKALLHSGENEQSQLSPSGHQLLFISKNRSFHKNSEIYELDLFNGKERRITFQDGDILSAKYFGNAQIIYTSTTDEDKEKLWLQEAPPKSPWRGSEIYLSDIYGDEIIRLTHDVGYDSDPEIKSVSPLEIYMTKYKDGSLNIYEVIPSKEISIPFVKNELANNFSPTFSPDKKSIAWIEEDKKDRSQNLVIQKNDAKRSQKKIKLNGFIKDLKWTSWENSKDGKILFSIQKGLDPIRIQLFDVESECLQTLIEGKEDFSQGEILHTEPKVLFFTRTNQGRKQIYQIKLDSNLGPCLSSFNSDRIK